MSINIVLDDGQDIEQAVYRPGDTIRGRVRYDVPKQQTINKATINFYGNIKTEWIPLQQGNLVIVQGPRRPSKEKITLFGQEVILFEGPYKVPPQVFEWPFALTLPTTCSWNAAPSSDAAYIAGLPDYDSKIALPPNYKWRDMLIGRDASGEIAYKAVVNVSNGSRIGGMFNDDKKEYLVQVGQIQASSVPGLDLKPTIYQFTPSIAWSSNSLRPTERRLSLKEKMKSTFSSDPTLKPPCLAFKTTIHIPCKLDLYQRFSVAFSVLREQKTENDPQSPTLVLSKLTLGLKSHTTMAISKKGFFQEERMAQGESTLTSHLVSLPTNGILLPITGDVVQIADDLCLADWTKAAVTSQDEPMLADFATWVLKLGHRMSVQATIRHAETGKEFRLASQFPMELTISNAIDADHSSYDHEDLPRYGDDVKPPAAAHQETG